MFATHVYARTLTQCRPGSHVEDGASRCGRRLQFRCGRREYVRSIAKDSSLLGTNVFESIHISGSGMDYRLSGAGCDVIQKLRQRVTRANVTYDPRRRYTRQSKVCPAIKPIQHRRETDHGDVLNQAIKLLFQCKLLVLGEYIACTIPLLYAIYLPILRQLHNGTYYRHLRALTANDLRSTVTSIAVFLALELLSLVLLHVYLRRQFRFSALHQLAFVLEEHVMVMQCKLIPEMIIALQFTIAHLGTLGLAALF